MSGVVRKATTDDVPELARVAAVTFPLACPPDTTDESKAAFIAAHLTEQHFAGYLADPAREVLLAEVDGAAAGYAMLVVEEPTDPDVVAAVAVRPTSELSKLYVLPDHHGGGVASALVAAAAGVARARGAAGMWLGVNQENERANRFYEKCGFRLVGHKRFQVGSRLEHDFVRERAL